MDNLRFVREFAPGAVGGKQVAEHASDAELSYLIVLGNEAARLHNEKLEVDRQINNLRTSILRKGGDKDGLPYR